MSEVIQPAPGQTVITTDHDHHRNHGGHHDHRNHLDELIAREQAAFGREAGLNAQTTMRDVKDARFDLAGNIDRVAAAAALGFGGVHDRLCDSTGKVIGALNTGFTAGALADCKLADAMNAGFAAANTQAAAIGSAAQVLATTFAGQARDDATRNANAASVQATGNFNLLTTQGTQNTYQVLLDAQKNATADQIEQVKNHNAVMLKLCECCHETQQGFQAAQAQADRLAAVAAADAARNACDIKQLITADGNATRALINQNTIDELRAFKASIPRGTPVTVPVGVS